MRNPRIPRAAVSPLPTSAVGFDDPFIAVDWLPPFDLRVDTLLTPGLVVNTPSMLAPFSRFTWHGGECLPQGLASETLFGFSDLELRSFARTIPDDDQSTEARLNRTICAVLPLTRRLTRRVDELGERQLLAKAGHNRRRFLQAIDSGSPFRAAFVRSLAFDAPGFLSNLGVAMPSREAVDLVHRHGPVLHLEAEAGLFALALHRRGVDVLATDTSLAASIGLCFPTTAGWPPHQAIATLDGAERSWLILWPHLETPWVTEVLKQAPAGKVVLIASPEIRFAAAGAFDEQHAGPVARHATEASALLGKRFHLEGEARMATIWPGFEPVLLSAYRRR